MENYTINIEQDFDHTPQGYLNKESLAMLYGESAQLTMTINYDCDIVWSSTDESVVVVDENGLVTPVDVGDATIIATTADGQVSKECAVTVDLKEISAYFRNMQTTNKVYIQNTCGLTIHVTKIDIPHLYFVGEKSTFDLDQEVLNGETFVFDPSDYNSNLSKEESYEVQNTKYHLPITSSHGTVTYTRKGRIYQTGIYIM